MIVTQTDRLRLRWFTLNDAPFVVELLNDPEWLRFIGDKQVRTLDDARRYIENEPLKMYRELGFGLYVVERVVDSMPMGMCGLKKRDGLDYPDIGFAFLPDFRGCGYAVEACVTVLQHAKNANGELKTVLAITNAANDRSAKVLEKIGMRFVGPITLPASSTELRLFELTAAM